MSEEQEAYDKEWEEVIEFSKLPKTEREAFERDIKFNRYDQATRLVFADWLDDHDFPEEANYQRAWTPEWQKAEDWLKDFCKRVDLNYEYFLKEVPRYLDSDFEAINDVNDLFANNWHAAAIKVTMNTSNFTCDEEMDEMWKNVAIYFRR